MLLRAEACSCWRCSRFLEWARASADPAQSLDLWARERWRGGVLARDSGSGAPSELYEPNRLEKATPCQFPKYGAA